MKHTVKSLSMRFMAMLVTLCLFLPSVALATDDSSSESFEFNLSNLNIDLNYGGTDTRIDLSDLTFDALCGMGEDFSRLLLSTQFGVKDKATVQFAFDAKETDTMLSIGNALLSFPTEKFAEAFDKIGEIFNLPQEYSIINMVKQYAANIELINYISAEYMPMFEAPISTAEVAEGTETITYKGQDHETSFIQLTVSREQMTKALENVFDKLATDDKLFVLLNNANITMEEASIQSFKDEILKAKEQAGNGYKSDLITKVYYIDTQIVGMTGSLDLMLDDNRDGRMSYTYFTFGQGNEASFELNASLCDISNIEQGIFFNLDYAPVVQDGSLGGTFNGSFTIMNEHVETGAVSEAFGIHMENEFEIEGYAQGLPSAVNLEGDIQMNVEGEDEPFGFEYEYAFEGTGEVGNEVFSLGMNDMDVVLHTEYDRTDDKNVSSKLLEIVSEEISAVIKSDYDGVKQVSEDGASVLEEGKYTLNVDVPMYETAITLTCDTSLKKGPLSGENIIEAGDAKVYDLLTLTDEDLAEIELAIGETLMKFVTALSEIPALQMYMPMYSMSSN